MKTIEILGFKAKVARTFRERTRGLIGTKSLAPNEGLLIEKCNAIHMCFMSFPIDAYFLDKDNQVVKVVRNIRPWRLWVWGGWRAVKVLETAVRKEGLSDEQIRIAVRSGLVRDGVECNESVGAEEPFAPDGGNDFSEATTRACSADEQLDVCYKPVIYLYPERETTCNVKVITDGALTCTYPEHGSDGWRDFVADPDGTLTFADGRQYYCLFWEGVTSTHWDFSRGYCVKGGETGAFLAEVLAKMGLSFCEANEFIIYWLPKMQENPYNVIAFQGERYAESARLEIEPQPDSLLRVFMAWKASNFPVDIPAPEIMPFERKGFTVIEWGGTEVGR